MVIAPPDTSNVNEEEGKRLGTTNSFPPSACNNTNHFSGGDYHPSSSSLSPSSSKKNTPSSIIAALVLNGDDTLMTSSSSSSNNNNCGGLVFGNDVDENDLKLLAAAAAAEEEGLVIGDGNGAVNHVQHEFPNQFNKAWSVITKRDHTSPHNPVVIPPPPLSSPPSREQGDSGGGPGPSGSRQHAGEDAIHLLSDCGKRAAGSGADQREGSKLPASRSPHVGNTCGGGGGNHRTTMKLDDDFVGGARDNRSKPLSKFFVNSETYDQDFPSVGQLNTAVTSPTEEFIGTESPDFKGLPLAGGERNPPFECIKTNTNTNLDEKSSSSYHSPNSVDKVAPKTFAQNISRGTHSSPTTTTTAVNPPKVFKEHQQESSWSFCNSCPTTSETDVKSFEIGANCSSITSPEPSLDSSAEKPGLSSATSSTTTKSSKIRKAGKNKKWVPLTIERPSFREEYLSSLKSSSPSSSSSNNNPSSHYNLPSSSSINNSNNNNNYYHHQQQQQHTTNHSRVNQQQQPIQSLPQNAQNYRTSSTSKQPYNSNLTYTSLPTNNNNNVFKNSSIGVSSTPSTSNAQTKNPNYEATAAYKGHRKSFSQQTYYSVEGTTLNNDTNEHDKKSSANHSDPKDNNNYITNTNKSEKFVSAAPADSGVTTSTTPYRRRLYNGGGSGGGARGYASSTTNQPDFSDSASCTESVTLNEGGRRSFSHQYYPPSPSSNNLKFNSSPFNHGSSFGWNTNRKWRYDLKRRYYPVNAILAPPISLVYAAPPFVSYMPSAAGVEGPTNIVGGYMPSQHHSPFYYGLMATAAPNVMFGGHHPFAPHGISFVDNYAQQYKPVYGDSDLTKAVVGVSSSSDDNVGSLGNHHLSPFRRRHQQQQQIIYPRPRPFKRVDDEFVNNNNNNSPNNNNTTMSYPPTVLATLNNGGKELLPNSVFMPPVVSTSSPTSRGGINNKVVLNLNGPPNNNNNNTHKISGTNFRDPITEDSSCDDLTSMTSSDNNNNLTNNGLPPPNLNIHHHPQQQQQQQQQVAASSYPYDNEAYPAMSGSTPFAAAQFIPTFFHHPPRVYIGHHQTPIVHHPQPLTISSPPPPPLMGAAATPIQQSILISPVSPVASNMAATYNGAVLIGSIPPQSLNSSPIASPTTPSDNIETKGVIFTVPLVDQIRSQFEYYFSEENLIKDVYLRSKMDYLGYIPLGLIVSFYRVKRLSQDVDIIKQAIEMSTRLELLATPNGEYRVRTRINPAIWPLSPAQLTNEKAIIHPEIDDSVVDAFHNGETAPISPKSAIISNNVIIGPKSDLPPKQLNVSNHAVHDSSLNKQPCSFPSLHDIQDIIENFNYVKFAKIYLSEQFHLPRNYKCSSSQTTLKRSKSFSTIPFSRPSLLLLKNGKAETAVENLSKSHFAGFQVIVKRYPNDTITACNVKKDPQNIPDSYSSYIFPKICHLPQTHRLLNDKLSRSMPQLLTARGKNNQFYAVSNDDEDVCFNYGWIMMDKNKHKGSINSNKMSSLNGYTDWLNFDQFYEDCFEKNGGSKGKNDWIRFWALFWVYHYLGGTLYTVNDMPSHTTMESIYPIVAHLTDFFNSLPIELLKDYISLGKLARYVV